MDLDHLRPEARDLAALPATERLTRLGVEHWIGYTRANQVLARLSGLVTHQPGRLRPQNLLVVGPSNNGKTMVAEKFARQHPARCSDDGAREVMPVVMTQMPAQPSVARFYTILLRALGTPVGFHARTDDKEALALRLMREVGCRVLVIDELHNVLGASAHRQRALLTLLRYLGNELRIPLACLGTREAYLAIRSDDQLENRFHPVLLPPWEDDAEFGRLLASFEATLPLREASRLGAPAMRGLVRRRSEGTIGEVALLLEHATTAALLAGRERITAEDLDGAGYEPPSVRRRLFERELR